MGEAKRRREAGLTWRNRPRRTTVAAPVRPKLRELIAERNAREDEFWGHRNTCAACAELGARDCGGAQGCARSNELERAWTLGRDAVEAWRLDRAFEREKETGVFMYRGVTL